MHDFLSNGTSRILILPYSGTLIRKLRRTYQGDHVANVLVLALKHSARTKSWYNMGVKIVTFCNCCSFQLNLTFSVRSENLNFVWICSFFIFFNSLNALMYMYSLAGYCKHCNIYALAVDGSYNLFKDQCVIWHIDLISDKKWSVSDYAVSRLVVLTFEWRHV